jgi:dTDP-4-amino-4,6-dideoxygalactose transaminase
VEPVYHLYVIRVQNRDDLQQYLAQRGIATGLHYPTPIHLQPAYAELDYQPGDFPITEALAHEILSLPMFPELSSEAVRYVVDAIAAFVTDAEAAVEPLPQLVAA